jgi:phage terminase large subunit GpA-like protein
VISASYAAAIEAMAGAIVERPPLTVSQWSDAHRIVPAGGSPEPGPWRTSRVPYIREPMDAVNDPSIRNVYIMASSQVSKSECLLNTAAYFSHYDPSPILIVQPTQEAARNFSKERVKRMFDASPALAGLLTDAVEESTMFSYHIPGGLLAFAWARSATSLASRAIRVLLSDEIDKWPESTGADGDPYAQARQRLANFYNAKNIAVSTPTIKGASAIERLFLSGDRCRYHVACPLCGTFQVLTWSGIVYKNAAGVVDLDDVHYRCSHCAGRIDESEKSSMLAGGYWAPGDRLDEDPAPEPKTRSFHISSLYSPWTSWSSLASEWIAAQLDKDLLQTFINLKLGEPWEEAGSKISVEELEKNRERYEADVPAGVLLLTAGVDVQDNRLECEIVGWGAGKESWGVEYLVVPGDTLTDDPWNRLDEILQRKWSKASGRALGLWCICVDSGHRADEVYEFCRRLVARNVFAVKGSNDASHPLVADKPTTSNKARINLYPVGSSTGKGVVYSRLKLPEPGPGYCHWPHGKGYDDEYFKQLTAEKRVGRAWVKTRDRNEALDIRVYATAAMEIMRPDFAALAEKETKERGPGGGGGAAPANTTTPKRRVLSRGVQW